MVPLSWRKTVFARFWWAGIPSLQAIVLALLIAACAVPRHEMHAPGLSSGKVPVVAAIIWPVEKMQGEWTPPLWSQGYVPRTVHSGQVLGQATVEAMALVFEKVSIAESESAARSRGAQVLIQPDFEWRVLNPSGATTITVKIEASLGQQAITVIENGIYDNPSVAVDDNHLRNAALNAFERIIPRLQSDRQLRAYARASPKGPETVAAPRARSRLGVFLTDAAEFGGVRRGQGPENQGPLVGKVTPGGPAERAGIKPGDTILAMNGIQVRNTESVPRIMQSVAPGDTVNVTISRAGSVMRLTMIAADSRAIAMTGTGQSERGKPSKPLSTTLADVAMTAEPQKVRIKGTTELRLRYSLAGGQGQVPVWETLTLSFEGKVLTGYPKKTEVTRVPGTHTSTYRQTIPEKAQPGSYRYAGEVCLGDDCRSHSGTFEVLP